MKTVSVIALICGACGAAAADGMMVPTKREWNQRMERAYIQEPAQKAFIHFAAGRERLIISPSFRGDAADFAWVVPVPSRPKVDKVDGALFHELASLMPKPAGGFGKGNGSESAPRAKGVTVLERRDVGAYDVAILSASDGTALIRWLDSNGYHLPGGAKKPVEDYVREKWTFVACRVRHPQKARGLRTGTLAPLSLEFATPRPVYPMRLSSANHGYFSIVLYLAMPRAESLGSRGSLRHTLGPPKYRHASTHWIAALTPNNREQLPTLSRYCKQITDIYILADGLDPKDSTRDFAWSTPRMQRASAAKSGLRWSFPSPPLRGPVS